MNFTDIIYEKKSGVARITINRSHVLNAFTNHTLEEMLEAFHDAGKDGSIGVIVLTGAGDRAFSAGGDVKWERAGGEEANWDRFPDVHNAIRCTLKPVIARINGYAIGGGHHLAYFCDLSIASERAIFGQNGPRVGSPADGFYVNYLIHLVGAKKAREIWYLCRRYPAREALAMGLVNAVVPHEQLDEEVDKWCREILEMSPTCIRILKASFERAFDHLRDLPFSIQRQLAPNFMGSEEQLEGQTAFLEKRKPDFSRFRQ